MAEHFKGLSTGLSLVLKHLSSNTRFKEQRGRCALGRKKLSRLTRLQILDHIMSVRYYATADLTIEEAKEQANREENLHLVCSHCNQMKGSIDIEEQPMDSKRRCGDRWCAPEPPTIEELQDLIERKTFYLQLHAKHKAYWPSFAVVRQSINESRKLLQQLLERRGVK